MHAAVKSWISRALCACILLIAGHTPVWAIGACPAIGKSGSCSILITIHPTGRLSFAVDPSVPPYDGEEDVLVGVQNRSGATVYGIQLSGTGIFGFDGDGAHGGAYGGTGISFSKQDATTGIVNFEQGLPDNSFLWFSLEGNPSQIRLASSVTIDPGHGSLCTSMGRDAGTVGATNFPASNPPPGRLREDDLTVAIALQAQSQLAAAGYRVAMTKTDVKSCPDFIERANKANNEKTNLFVSVHINAPARFPLLPHGTSALYNSAKSSSRTLGVLLANSVSSSVGVSNRGTTIRNNLAVLKPTASRMSAVMIEVARLSSGDEAILHNAAASSLAATGIKAGLDAFIQQ